jgi:hypothetical protein
VPQVELLYPACGITAPLLSDETHVRKYMLRRRQVLLFMDVSPLMIEQPPAFSNR